MFTFVKSKTMRLNDTIAQIGKDYDVTIIQVVEGDEHCLANGLEAYLNRSCVCGSIYLGIYEDDDKKLISLLHEVGHLVDKTPYYEDYLNYTYEKNAWDVAYILAPKYGLVVTDELRKWCNEQLETYYGWELNEWTGLGMEKCAQTLRDFNGDWRKAKAHLLSQI